MMNDRWDPLAAVTSPDPYPYYAQLVAERPLYRDERLNLWVASSVRAVEAAFSNPDLCVRPVSEPVPQALVDSSVGVLFGRLVRMNEGEAHGALRAAVTAAFERFDWGDATIIIERCARYLAGLMSWENRSVISTYTFGMPALAVAAMLGFPLDDAERTVGWTRDFAGAMLPAPSSDTITQGSRAVDALLAHLGSLSEERSQPSLFIALIEEGRRAKIADEVILANAVGFLFQTYDATAALLCNVLLAVKQRPSSDRDRLCEDATMLDTLISDIVRYDPPVHNTRRFAARDTTVLDASIRAGESVLIVMAAANRDPNAQRSYTFGMGTHACPGTRVALAIARAGIVSLLGSPLVLDKVCASGYLPRANLRSPILSGVRG